MRKERRAIDWDKGGSVSAVIAYPQRHRPGVTPTVVLAHGAGNDMNNALLSGVHQGLAERGLVAVKFNFPYTEQGRRAPDRAPVLEACYRAVIDTIRADPTLVPQTLIIGGKSMGGRMASHLAAQGVAVAGLLFLGYPLHPAGQPDKLRVAHLGAIMAPILFFAGTRDALCSLDLLRAALAKLPRATLHVIEGGDHSFALPRRMQRSAQEVVDEIVGASADWIAQIARR